MFKVFSYSVTMPKGSGNYRTKKATLVKKFADLRSAQDFVAGKTGHFIQYPERAIQEYQT